MRSVTKEATLPSRYAGWLRDAAGGPIAAETTATCDRCVMLAPPRASVQALYFGASTKCCTFQPTIVNFTAGAILRDRDAAIAEGRGALERRITARVGVAPAGVLAGAVFGLLYNNVSDAFGRASSLACPYLTANADCGLWHHRPGVCATWFCKHDRGDTGFRFWSLAGKLLRAIEQDLALWCMSELNAGLGDFAASTSERQRPDAAELDRRVDERQYEKLWGAWAGRERDFYEQCAARVDGLGWPDVLAICGPRVRILAGLVRDARAHRESQAIPARLRLNEFRVTASAAGGFTVMTYSAYDPLAMSERLVRVLPHFDGRATEDALAAILGEHGLTLAPSLVRRLVDFGVLSACDTAAADAALPLTFNR